MGKINLYKNAIGLSVKANFMAAPLYYIAELIIHFFQVVIPFIVLWNWRFLINVLTGEKTEQAYRLALVAIAIFVITNIISNVVQTAISYVYDYRTELTRRDLEDALTSRANKIAIKYYDTAKFYDQLELANGRISDVLGLEYDVRQAIGEIVSLIGSAFLLGQAFPMGVVLLALFYIPTTIAATVNARKERERTETIQIIVRRKNYYREVLTTKKYAKEVRIYQLGNFIKERYYTCWERIYQINRKLLFKNNMIDMVGYIFGYLGMIVIFIFTTISAVAQKIDIGAIPYNIGLAKEFSSALRSFLYGAADLKEVFYCVGEYIKFYEEVEIEGELVDQSGPLQFETLEFRDVSFAYPGTQKKILNNLSFNIQAGDKVSLVGLNGSGKSTLIKLILGYYKPDTGEVLVNGQSIDAIHPEDLRSIFSVLFQNYNIYSFTLKENIQMFDGQDDRETLAQSIQNSGCDQFMAEWSLKEDTPMTKNFDKEGKELSGGQNQKIALARALYRQGQFIILDEPSSAMDAEAEDYIFKTMIEHCQGKTAVFISHRLSTSSLADYIIFLEDGQVKEQGSHEVLIASNQKYAYLYQLQAEKYKENRDTDEEGGIGNVS